MRRFLSLAAVCVFALGVWAQETVAVNTGNLVSPEVKNQTITFRLWAPEAENVSVEADFLRRPGNRLHWEKWKWLEGFRCRKAKMECGLTQPRYLRRNCTPIVSM